MSHTITATSGARATAIKENTDPSAPRNIGAPSRMMALGSEPNLFGLAESAERAMVLPFRAWVLKERQELEASAANLRGNLRDYEMLARAQRHKAEPLEMCDDTGEYWAVAVPPVVWAWASASLGLAEVEAQLVPFNAYFLAAAHPANDCSLNFPQVGNDAAVRELWLLWQSEEGSPGTDASDGDA